MAVNYDLNNTGPEVQARLDQVLQNEASISEETLQREGADDVLRQDMENYTDAVDLRLSGELNELGIRLNAESSRAQLKEAELQSQADSLSANKANKSEVTTELNKKANAANVYTKLETYSRTEINNLVTTPDQQFVTVVATSETTSVTDVLPATGAANTIYRVGSWDGTQYDASAYSEYAWDGTQYKLLSTKDTTIDIIPFSGSTALAESGGIAKVIGYSSRRLFFDSNHIVNVNNTTSIITITYQYNVQWDCVWIPLNGNVKQIVLSGAVFSNYRFFSSYEISYANYIDVNTTGVVPSGAVVCTVSMSKASNPDGYDDIRVEITEKIDSVPTQGSDRPITSGAVYGMQDSIKMNSVKVGSLYPNDVYIDPNHLCTFLNGAFDGYKSNSGWDAIWITPQLGCTQISISGVTEGKKTYFSDINPSSDNYIGNNDDGTIIEGTKLVIINLNKSSNPNGYDDLVVKQNSVITTEDIQELRNEIKRASQGFVLDKDHLINIISSQNMRYQQNSSWNCLIIPISDSSVNRVEVSGVEGGKYRFFSTMDLSGNLAEYFLEANNDGNVPEGSVVCLQNLAKADNPDGYDNAVLRTYSDKEKTIRLLSIGNSYSQDALAYVPFILQNMGIYNVQIGILMQSSSSLEMHVENFENETAAFTFYLYNGGSSWLNIGLKTIQWALDNYEWDLVSLQQSSNSASPSWADYQPWCNRLINDVSGYVDYPVKFIWYQPQTRPASTNGGANWDETVIAQHYAASTEASERIYDETCCEYVVPVGTAMQNARTIASLKAMGDYASNQYNTSGLGYLECEDGVHAQEGLPCQLEAYTFILALLKIYGYKEYSINGETTRVNAGWMTGKNIPGPHGNPIGSTDENCLIAQKCAIMAMKHPYEVTDMNYIINPS